MNKPENFDLVFAVPLSVKIGGKGKKLILNQNKFRNTHFRTMNDAKKNFHDIIANMNLADHRMPFQNPVRLHYYYYPKSKGSYDRMNVASAIDKFLCDALIECGVLRDDNYKMVLWPQFYHCRVDRENPRCEVFIVEEK